MPSMIWVVQYVGNLAWHQNIERHINNYDVNTDLNIRCNAGDGGNKYNNGDDVCPNGTSPSSLSNAALFRSFQGWGDINQQENTTNGNYNGFQTGLRIQNRWGLSGEVDYTYSHEIDLTTYDLKPISNPWNLKYDKGSGTLDRRHILSANYVYQLPFFTNSSGWTKTFLGAWELAGTFLDQTGVVPADQGPGLSISYDSIGLGGGYTNRPDQSSKTHYLKQRNEWFDKSAFSAPIPAWLGGPNLGFGNARKDTIVGPGRVNFTTSLYKSFQMTERAHFELRFESFNTFNHFQPNGLNVSYGASQFS